MSRRSNRPPKMAIIAAQQIVADINKRGNIPGDRLPPERTMLEQFQIGRGTLREALRFLELQGVIALKPGPGGGPIVQRPDSSSLETTLTLLLQFEHAPYRSIAESRLGLEPMMTRLAATRMSDELRAELTQSVDDMRARIDDQSVFLETNKQFHSVIAEGSENPMLGCLIDALLNLLDGSAIGVDYPERRRRAVVKAHQEIHDAIIAGDPDAAEAAMKSHIQEYLAYLDRTHPEALEWPIVWGAR